MKMSRYHELYRARAKTVGQKLVATCALFLPVVISVTVISFFSMLASTETDPVYAAMAAEGVDADISAGQSEAEQGLFDLVINEFMASNNGTAVDSVDLSSSEDWFEIYNPTSEPVNLQGMYVTDTLADPVKHQITVTLFIQPQSYLLFWADDEPDQGPTHLPFKLKASGEALALYAPNGETEIDAYIFDQQQENVSEGRSPDGGNSWIKYLTPTPGESNIVVPEVSGVAYEPEIPFPFQSVDITAVITDDTFITGVTLYYSTTNILSSVTTELTSLSMTLNSGTTGSGNTYGVQIPGQPDNTLVSYYIEATDQVGNIGRNPKTAPATSKKYLVGYEPPTLIINEMMPHNVSILEDPQEPLEFPDWIEIYNFGTFSVSLNGLHLSDDPDEPDKYAIPAGIVVMPNSYLVFFADDDGTQGAFHTNFKLSNAGEQIGLYGPYGAAPIDTVTYTMQPMDTPVGRYPNAYGAFGQEALCATPGEVNQLCNNYTFLPLFAR